MDMVSIGLLRYYKHLFNQQWSNLWDLPGNNNKAWVDRGDSRNKMW